MKRMPGRVTKQTFTLINPTVTIFSLSFYFPNSGSWRFMTVSPSCPAQVVDLFLLQSGRGCPCEVLSHGGAGGIKSLSAVCNTKVSVARLHGTVSLLQGHGWMFVVILSKLE